MSEGERTTGRFLNDQWGVGAKHALYHHEGNWYENLIEFPGALFDPNGYVLFETEEEYRNSPFLDIGQKLHVKPNIAALPNYRQVRPIEGQQAADIGEQEGPGRAETTVNRIIRDTALAQQIKQLHQNRCQICGHALPLSGGNTYAEGHHIRPLGSPHNGPDVKENIICVCPNCHAQLDYGAITLDVKRLKTALGHSVGPEYIDYHNGVIAGTRQGALFD